MDSHLLKEGHLFLCHGLEFNDLAVVAGLFAHVNIHLEAKIYINIVNVPFSQTCNSVLSE